MQMAKFVKTTKNVRTFENWRAFYEFTRGEEDLDSYKDVVLMVSGKVTYMPFTESNLWDL